MRGKKILFWVLGTILLCLNVPADHAVSTAAHGQETEADTEMTSVEELDLKDGVYLASVSLSGGSGRASVTSPARICVESGSASIFIEFSSPWYDYLLVDGIRYEPVSGEGENSVFEVPLPGFDFDWAVTADTTAMSEPHEIDYTIRVDSAAVTRTEESREGTENISENQSEGTGETGDSGKSTQEATEIDSDDVHSGKLTDDVSKVYVKRSHPVSIDGLEYEKSLALYFASGFSVDYYQGGFKYVTISNGDGFLVLSEGQSAPSVLPDNTQVIEQPFDQIYLAATSAMDDFRALDSIGSITLSCVEADGWYIDEAREAMENGSIAYAGKYSAPDYELIASQGCDLAVESTMIYHTPQVEEQLKQLGIPVLVERSSYESEPLGRSEWIKLYGALLDKEEEASAQFAQMVKKAAAVVADTSEGSAGKTVAYFSISTEGYATVRKTNDYISKMISLAGGEYIFQDLGDEETALSTVKMQMEDFYAGARDADYIIYNSTIEGEVEDIDSLLGKSSLLKDFRAVKNGNAWCMTQSVFQKTTAAADIIVDFHTMLTDPDADQLTYMYRLH